MSKVDREGVEIESDGSSEMDLDNFKKGVEFPLPKLQELVYNDRKFASTIISFIRQAIKKMRRDEYRYSIIYLTEAEKILEYGASCGKVIDRRLIICVLHNQACCFQKMNDKAKAAKYIQAILYNLRAHLHSLQGTPTTSNIIQSAMLKATSDCAQITFARKLELAQYNLQFCSLNSQLKYRKQALQAGKGAIQLYKGFFMELKNEYRSIQEFDFPSLEDKTRIIKSFNELKIFRDTVDLNILDIYVKICKQVLRKWINDNKGSNKSLLDKHFADYSIGNLVQMESVDYQESESSGNLLEGKKIMEQLVHCSMGYFQIATQYRLLAEERYQLDQINKLSSDEFKYSNIYHALSIIFISLYIPFNLLFLHQIVESYKFHYKMDLMKDTSLQSSNLQLSVLFNLDTSRDKKSTTSSKKLTLTSKRKKSQEKATHNRKISRNKLQNSNNHSKMSGSTSKNQYFFKSPDNPSNKVRRKRMVSSQSKKSCGSSNSKNYYLQTKKQIKQDRPITAHTMQTCRSARLHTSTSNKVQKQASERLKSPLDQYGTNSQLKMNGGNFKQTKKSRKSSRSNSTDRNGYMLRKVCSQSIFTKIQTTKQIKQKKKESVGAKSKQKKVGGERIKGAKLKKTITNYYL